MRCLICYATTEGHTEKVARFAASVVEEAGHDAQIFNLNSAATAPDPGEFERVIVAGSVHEDQHQELLGAFVLARKQALEATPSMFVSVSLSAAFESTRKSAEGYVKVFLDQHDWQPERYLLVAGAIRHAAYGYYQEMIVKYRALPEHAMDLSDEDREFTDWAALEAEVKNFVGE